MLNQYSSIWELAVSITGLSETVLSQLSLRTYDTVKQMLVYLPSVLINLTHGSSVLFVFHIVSNIKLFDICIMDFIIFVAEVQIPRYFIDYITSTSACVYFSCCASQRLLNLQGWEKGRGRKRAPSSRFQSPGRPHNGAATRDAIWMKWRNKWLNNTELREQRKNRNRTLLRKTRGRSRLSKEYRWLAS